MGSPIGGPIGGQGAGGGSSSCLTMFGLSYDATEREVHILFSGCSGYVRCIVVPSKDYVKKPYAFIQFDLQENAVAAMDSRQGTYWEDGMQVVNIEISKRDIPDKFQPRQHRGADPNYGVPPPAYHAPDPSYGRKRQRVEEPAWAAAPPPMAYSNHSGSGGYGSSAEDGPRTLHLGGLPGGMVQADLDDFLANNFGQECIGGKLTGGGRSECARAFVGFVSHDAATTAMGALEGFNWEGSSLHAEWARTEFRLPGSGGGKGGGKDAPAYLPPAPPPAHRNSASGSSWGGSHRGYSSDDHSSGGWGSSKGKGSKGSSDVPGGKCTLHFTNLPTVSDAEFGEFITETFPEQVTCSRFVDKCDGRPPVAWVRFVDEVTAADVQNSHEKFDWGGKTVAVQFARTELDPSKAGKGR